MPQLRLPAILDNLGKLISFVTECAGKQGYSAAELHRIELAAEEVLVNICRYAYPGKKGDIEIICKVGKDASVIEIIDTGIPFDCSNETCPDLDANLCDRKLGGLGIYLMHKMVDEVTYCRDGDRNILTLVYRPGRMTLEKAGKKTGETTRERD
jgi:anti-sigma regulatory factor (Ser/Thr protein kinase)